MLNPVICLASNSPRRRQLLALTGWTFMVRPVDIDEAPHVGEAPDRYVMRLAEEKVNASFASFTDGCDASVIVGSDTTVAAGTNILGKPADAQEAAAMLQALRAQPDRTHTVFTAVAVYLPERNLMRVDLCATDVRMRDYTDEEIAVYAASGDPLDKAGAYAIQHAGFHPVEAITGCYAGVMGFPLCHLLRTIRALGFDSARDVPGECQASLGHVCPVFQSILEGSGPR